jgi:hypothetical protein
VEGKGNGELGFCGNQSFAETGYGRQLILEKKLRI